MLSRFLFAFGFALSGFVAATGVASADVPEWNQDEVMVVTVLVVAGLLLLLGLGYAIRWYFGLIPEPPAAESEEHGHH
jgi:hypothetical protein